MPDITGDWGRSADEDVRPSNDRPNDTRCLCNWRKHPSEPGFVIYKTSDECPMHNPRTPQATILATQARALATHIEAFNDLVARDTNTHDGKPRGKDWQEGGTWSGNVTIVSYRALNNWNCLLCDLADLWDFG